MGEVTFKVKSGKWDLRLLSDKLCYYGKPINCCYMSEQCAIDFKIPLTPFFQRGKTLSPSLEKRG
jgi:hypothetical protein